MHNMAASRKKYVNISRTKCMPCFNVLIVFISCYMSLIASVYCDECNVNGISLNQLARFDYWDVSAKNGNLSYRIHLCGSVKGECHDGTSVCMKKGDTSYSIGNLTNPANISVGANDKIGEMWIVLSGDQCLEDKDEHMNSIINMKCGKTLGSPEYLEYTGCTTYFEWITSAVCKNVTVPEKEVPCYLLDDQNEKYDLSPLIKLKGGYMVDSTEGWEFYINVCRDITADARTTNCLKGSAACKVKGQTVMNLGQPQDRLQRLPGKLRLTYLSEVKPDGCTQKPNTTIDFICPKVGGSKDPLLVSDFNCQYYIQWYTERACLVRSITNKSCILHNEERNIDIDLTPLTKSPGDSQPYNTYQRYNQGKYPYRYYINVCGELGIQCPDDNHVKDVAACQTQIGNSSYGFIMGKVGHQQLSYADGEIKLIYTGGDVCNNTKFQRSTVILFNCNKTAGKGAPVFDKEIDCMYLFNWETSYACLDHPVVQECRINFSGKRFDLSPLVRRTGTNWEALHSEGDQTGSQIYINICNDLILQGKSSSCPPDASVCLIDKDGSPHNLGKYSGGPRVDPLSKTLQINYTNGDICIKGTNRRTYSVIIFLCKPGDLQSGPVLLDKSLDGCVYVFEWHTAAACVLAKKDGTNCRVSDNYSGVNFDLSRLTKHTGYYNASNGGEYDYRINVCSAVAAKPCGTNTNPGVCQVKHTDNSAYNIGQYSTKLEYFDGMINLTYANGDLYHSGRPRKTEIAFMCDPDIGIGNPAFVEESSNAYTFIWSTSYACPTAPVECTVTDPKTNKQYDLSSLTRKGQQENWAIEDEQNRNFKLKYYINVCRSLNIVTVKDGTRPCGAFASVCATEIKNGTEAPHLGYSNMGEVSTGPVVVNTGTLLLTYVSSEHCQGSAKMTTDIHFICKKGALTQGPNIPIRINMCHYSVVWETEAACPIEDIKVEVPEACTIKDPNSDYVFNLQPLSKNGNLDYFTANSSNGHTYRLRICGSLKESDCGKIETVESAVCEVLPNGSKPGLAYARQFLEFSDDGRTQLTYAGRRLNNGQLVNVKIIFQCRKNVEIGKPVLSSIIEHTYIFTFETPLACRPEPVDCLVQDSKGNQYDLSPLVRTSVNWKVLDTRGGGSDHTYYINVCRPVIAMNGLSCPGGPVGGCQTLRDGRSFNMGYIQSKPIAREDGTLTLSYRNGDICHKGTPRQSHRSTRINFYCSTVEHNPTFEGETETCEYTFNWQTPSACPVQRVTGSHCRVTDPLYNIQFDFTALRKSHDDYHVKFGQYDYLLNLCGPLVNKCNGQADSAVCQTKPGTPNFNVIAGLDSTSSLVYDSGEITVTYTGGNGSCHNKYTRSTIITFVCDQSKKGHDGPKFLNESATCTYLFEWPTSLACPPYKIGDCSATDNNGNEYDLSTLSSTKNNIGFIEHYQKTKYLINVCRSLVHLKGETCPPNSAACIVDLNQTNNTLKFHNIGEVNENQVLFKDGKLQLFYNNGEVCRSDISKRYSTRIILNCDQNAIDTHPTGHFTVGCEHRFVWYTRAACSLKETQTSDSGNCTVKNPRTGHVFDLNSLANDNGYELGDNRGHKFKINICNPVKGSRCNDPTTGACQEEQTGEMRTFNSGNANKKLQYDNGVLFLNYTGGHLCHNKFQRNVIINFVCSSNAGKGKPVFIDETGDCTYYISWHTALACEEKVKCSLDINSKTVDLSPLIKSEGFHLAISTLSTISTSNSTFYINVCEPLNPIYGTLCPPGASACMLQNGHKPLGLGKLHNPPYQDKVTGKIVLVYDHGDPSPADPTKNISTKIIFSCKSGPSMGTPYLEQITEDYQYVFSWETNVVCTDEIKQTTDCVFTDPQTKTKFNLTSLNTGIPYKVHSKSQNVDYLISICDNLKNPPSGCSGAGICRVSGSHGANMGKATDITFEKYEDVYRMKYNKGNACMDKSYNHAVINFRCDFGADHGPTYLSDSWCDVQLDWRTKAVCSAVADQCSFAYGGHVYDLSMLSSQRSSWNLTDSDGNTYWINICQGIHRGPGTTLCPNLAGACRKTKSGRIDNLGFVEKQRIYMDSDGKTIVLEYSQGDTACASKHRRSNNIAAKTIIKFECGKTVGGPVYIPGKSDNGNCVFEFHWKSRIACMIKREKLSERNGTLYDPEVNRVISLSDIHGTYNVKGDNQYTYSIDLKGQACGRNTVICKQHNSESHVLGLNNKREYYMEDGILEAEYTSSDLCERDKSKNVKTIIQFHCNSQEGNPIFFSESSDCVYVFTWGTPVLCMTPVVINPGPASGGSVSSSGTGNSSKVKSSTVAAIIGVFSAAILICVLLIVFHKKERRDAFASKIKRLVRRSDSTMSFRYDALPQTSDNEEEDENDEIMICTDASATETETKVKSVKPAQSYHDDSDEDLLL